MQPHEELRGHIPAYVLSKLEPEARRELEAHLRECKACSEMVAVCREIASVLRDGGADLFGGHPASLTLREYALHGEAARDSEVARHLTSCAECRLDLAVWKARPQGEPRFRTGESGALAPASPRRLRLVALAAGVVLGIGVSIVSRFVATPAPRTPATEQDSASRMAAGTRPLQLFVLDGPLRGAGEVRAFKVEPDQSTVLLAVRPILPPGVAESALYRFEIRSARQEVWKSDLTASQIHQYLQASEVTTLVIPATSLPPGRYHLKLLSPQGGRALMDLPFDIVH